MPQPVILLASSRKGTHLVLTALAQHPEVYAYRQMLQVDGFYPNDTGQQLMERFCRDGDPPAWSEHDFASTSVVVIPACWSRAAERHPGWWQTLHELRAPVIHLHRRNMLRWYVSWHLAIVSGQWIAGRKPDPTTLKIAIDPLEFSRHVLNDWRNEFQARRFFAGHPVLHLWYEDLTADFDHQMDAVQSFLGIENRTLRPVCYKQQTRPLDEVIANYAELRDAWVGTPWQAFLEDETRTSVTPNEPRSEK